MNSYVNFATLPKSCHAAKNLPDCLICPKQQKLVYPKNKSGQSTKITFCLIPSRLWDKKAFAFDPIELPFIVLDYVPTKVIEPYAPLEL